MTLLPPSDELFALVVNEAYDFAIFLVDLDGNIASWNRGAERMFGWAESEVINQRFSRLFAPDDRDRGIPEKELATAREKGRSADTRWHVRKDGRRVFLDGVTTALRDESGNIIGYSKIARDMTDRVMAERRLGAQLALSNALNTDAPFDQTARRIMQTICETLQWDVGALWLVDEERDVLRAVDAWSETGDGPAAIAAGEMQRGVGLPGRVWETSQPAWISDVSRDGNFPRAAMMSSTGLRAAFAFPIQFAGRVVGVMEFFSRRSREPDQSLMPVMTLVGTQIGDYLERRRTAEALRLSEEKYRVIAESAQDAIITIDASSRVLFANAAAERMFGYKASDLIGQLLDRVIPERLRDQHRRGIERYLNTGEKRIAWKSFETTALRSDGTEFPIELSFGELAAPSGRVFSGVARDITERKQAREALQRSLADARGTHAQLVRRTEEETAFRELASALSGAVETSDVMHEITSRATTVTRADGVYVERISSDARTVEVVSTFGRRTPPRGTRVAFPGSLTETILESRAPVIVPDLTTGFGQSMAPYIRQCCPECEVLVAPLMAEDDALGALVLLNGAESGRRFREEDVLRARTVADVVSLALRRVRFIEREREAKERAEAAVRVRDETLGIVSHDLRNPLTSIALSAALLADTSSGEQREHVDHIRRAAHQMQRLIEDLLDVARIEAGGISLKTAVIDAGDLARLTCDANMVLAEAKRQKIVCDVPPLPPVCADRDRILQVLGNLVGNAMKFTPSGCSIFVTGFERDRFVVLQVRDSGPGIPESDLKNVFTPYWQAKKTAHLGAGLGLAIVRGIVEAHGGTVQAANAPGGGALFTFTLPKA